MKTKVFPINNCMECPKFNEEPIYYECILSDVRCYEKDGDWEEYLEQFCPLSYLEDIIEESYNKGKDFRQMEKKLTGEDKNSVNPNKWVTTHKFLEKVNDLQGE